MGEDFRADGNNGERCEHLRIEGCKRKVLAFGEFNEQGVVHRHFRLNRPFKSTLPQSFARDGLNPNLRREAEALPAVLGANAGVDASRVDPKSYRVILQV